ncbi:MAG: type II toxin-antitoxin system antitoxin SocA domain-containing protein [bacterium]
MKTITLPSASEYAKYFIWKASQEGKKITNKKLQKLLYYAQAWHLAIGDKPLFKDPIEAWIHGPAIRSVYGQYKKYGFGYIDESINEKEIEGISSDKFLDEIWRVYGKHNAEYLEELTHNEEPWQVARGEIDGGVSSTNIISHDVMKSYYRKRLKDSKK